MCLFESKNPQTRYNSNLFVLVYVVTSMAINFIIYRFFVFNSIMLEYITPHYLPNHERGDVVLKENEKREIMARLSFFETNGVKIYLDGNLSTPEEIADTYCLNEDCVYMPDYVISEKGSLEEVRFDKIKEF